MDYEARCQELEQEVCMLKDKLEKFTNHSKVYYEKNKEIPQ